MTHSPEGPTDPKLVKKISKAIAILEETIAMPLEITREDDFALMTALRNLQQIEANQETPP